MKKMADSVYLVLTALFMIFAAGITVYSVYSYRASLPEVTVESFASVEMDGRVYDTAVLKTALYPAAMPMTYDLYSAEKEPGPWGGQYVVKKNTVLCTDQMYYDDTLEYVPVSCFTDVFGEIIISDSTCLEEGDVVRIRR